MIVACSSQEQLVNSFLEISNCTLDNKFVECKSKILMSDYNMDHLTKHEINCLDTFIPNDLNEASLNHETKLSNIPKTHIDYNITDTDS